MHEWVRLCVRVASAKESHQLTRVTCALLIVVDARQCLCYLTSVLDMQMGKKREDVTKESQS